jgi:hypothetical protein
MNNEAKVLGIFGSPRRGGNTESGQKCKLINNYITLREGK